MAEQINHTLKVRITDLTDGNCLIHLTPETLVRLAELLGAQNTAESE